MNVYYFKVGPKLALLELLTKFVMIMKDPSRPWDGMWDSKAHQKLDKKENMFSIAQKAFKHVRFLK